MMVNEWNFNIIYQEVSRLLTEFRWGGSLKQYFSILPLASNGFVWGFYEQRGMEMTK